MFRKEAMKVWVPILLVVVGGFFLAAKFVEPPPPRSLTIVTGSPSGAYFELGLRYKKELEAYGIDVQVVETNGSRENCERIAADASGKTVGFVQGGSIAAGEFEGLQTVASLYYEPLWVFFKKPAFGPEGLHLLTDLHGKRVAVGPEGSGTRPVALRLLKANGLDESTCELLPYGSVEAKEALEKGAIDAALMVSGPQAHVVTELLQAPDIGLMSFKRHLAYVRKLSYVQRVDLHEGMIDLERGLPARDTVLLAATAALVVNAAVHPGIVELLYKAAMKIHQPGGILEAPRQFPSSHWGDALPMNETAVRLLEDGPSFLSRYLPFWAVSLIRQFKILLLPLVTLLLPMMKIAPAIYRWRMNRKIFSWYTHLQEIEGIAQDARDIEALRDAEARLEELDREVAGVRVPLVFMKDVYNLRLHISMIVRDLTRRAETT